VVNNVLTNELFGVSPLFHGSHACYYATQYLHIMFDCKTYTLLLPCYIVAYARECLRYASNNAVYGYTVLVLKNKRHERVIVLAVLTKR